MGVWSEGGGHTPEMATAAVCTHPTGMHFLLIIMIIIARVNNLQGLFVRDVDVHRNRWGRVVFRCFLRSR